ncbi:sensor histidine kinase [Noviherbaspirillum cavernae]|nr:7TM diverse intracellular signaling domain-containing protein [Noviherbaspirillum cavernae]
MLEYLNMAGAVYLNDVLLDSDPRLLEPLTRAWNTPRYWLLSPPVLRAGTNTLLIRVSGLAAYQPGLGMLHVGEPNVIHERYKHERRLRHDLQFFSLAVTATLGCFFLPLWLMRRRETAFGWFGLMSLAAWCYELNQVATSPWPFADNHGWEIANSIAFLLYSASFTMFVLRFCERRYPRIEGAFWTLVASGALALVFTPHAHIQVMRDIMAALPGLTYFASCILFFTFAWRSRRPDQLILSLCVAVFILVGIHDFLVFFKVLDSNIYYAALTSPIQLISMAMVLGWRFVANLRRIERFNEELNLKVSAATEELAATLKRQHELEVVNVRLGERLNLAHDLHDGLGGTLVSSIATLEHAPEGIPSERFLTILKELRDDLRIVVDAASSHQFAETSLADMIAPLRHRLTRLFENQQIACHWQLSGIDRCYLAASDSLDVMRILQEGLTNVLKHSRADRVNTELVYSAQSLDLVITDNGIGLTPEPVEWQTGAGMRSMQRRANRLGGVFKIVHASGNTVLTVHIPYKSKVAKEEKLTS